MQKGKRFLKTIQKQKYRQHTKIIPKKELKRQKNTIQRFMCPNKENNTILTKPQMNSLVKQNCELRVKSPSQLWLLSVQKSTKIMQCGKNIFKK